MQGLLKIFLKTLLWYFNKDVSNKQTNKQNFTVKQKADLKKNHVSRGKTEFSFQILSQPFFKKSYTQQEGKSESCRPCSHRDSHPHAGTGEQAPLATSMCKDLVSLREESS